MAKIKGFFKGELDVKRFYLPGIVIEDNCSECNKLVKFDGENDYLSYPNMDELQMIHMYCEDCNHDWSLPVKLEVKVSLTEKIEPTAEVYYNK